MPRRSLLTALSGGAAIGVLGGLIGLGGAEFWLPLLVTVFGFIALEAVIVNKAISLIVVASVLAFRSTTIPIETMLDHGSIVINLLAGALGGAWIGADLATRLATATLYRVIAVLLVLMALVLAFAHDPLSPGEPIAHGATLVALGLLAGLSIGVIAALLGVAGGELLIPTLVLLFGADIKLAGSLSLAVSLPTMLVGFARYSRDRSFAVLGANREGALAAAQPGEIVAVSGFLTASGEVVATRIARTDSQGEFLLRGWFPRRTRQSAAYGSAGSTSTTHRPPSTGRSSPTVIPRSATRSWCSRMPAPPADFSRPAR